MLAEPPLLEVRDLCVGFRTEGDWTTPEQVTGLALALASGSLDAFTGRYVRAGADTEESLRAEAAAGLSDSTRRLVLG